MVIVASNRVSPLAARSRPEADDPVMQVGPALLEEAAEGAVIEMAVRVHVAVQRPVAEPDGVVPGVEPVGLLDRRRPDTVWPGRTAPAISRY